MVPTSKFHPSPLPPREPLRPYCLVREEVLPDSGAVQIMAKGIDGGASLPLGGANPVMSKDWSPPSMIIAVDRASLQVKEGTARVHARPVWPAQLVGSSLDTSAWGRAVSTCRKMCLPSLLPLGPVCYSNHRCGC